MSSIYSYNPRDLKFILKEWLPTEEIFAYDKFKDYYSKDDIDMLVDQVHKIAAEVIAPCADELEEHGVKFENGKVTLAPGATKIFKYIQENGWGTSNIDENAEGTIPEVVMCSLMEMIQAACPAGISSVGLTTGAARLIQTFGDEKLKQMFLPKMFDGTWSGTMCLTEPTAGSDVGDILSKAYPTDHPRIYKIKGTKQFITFGDGDFAENIIHLLLARIDGAAPGTKGISLFVVPKYWVNEDGSLEDNDVVTTAIEHKMGLHGQPTAALAFGDNDGCRGWLLGNPPGPDGVAEGMAQMFQMMNEERQGTGLLATCVAANAYWNAKNYAKERIQGRPMSNPKGERTAIINHDDVKRMLMVNKATLEACRAMIHKCYYYVDIAHNDPDPERRKWAMGKVDVLTPICKAYPSDEAWGLIAESIQTHGGYGFCEDYPVAQAARDVKIYSIWEGTNFIQAQDLLGRKWTMNKGQTFQDFLKDIDDFLAAHKGSVPAELEKEFANLEKAMASYREIMMAMGGYMAQKKFGYFQVYARRILTATAQVYGGYCLLDQALIALKRMKELGPDHYDYNFYYGKLLSTKYYLRNVVPYVWYIAELVKDGDTSVIDAPPEIFEY
ncbi:MAG: acyl-CoA dehydrogenase [Syntrophomonadaceae bacterium]|nr:acyl-CoA dehydrogenase [Syntrophomonadaceae bacterium]